MGVGSGRSNIRRWPKRCGGWPKATANSPTFAIRAYLRAKPLILQGHRIEGRHYSDFVEVVLPVGWLIRIRGGGC